MKRFGIPRMFVRPTDRSSKERLLLNAYSEQIPIEYLLLKKGVLLERLNEKGEGTTCHFFSESSRKTHSSRENNRK